MQPNRYHGVQYGNAMHSIMQHLHFESCDSKLTIQQDISRLVSAGLITPQQAEIVNVDAIYRFFQTDIGSRLRNCRDVLREFKFSILEDASIYYSDVHDEKILLQGVIDCALIESDGITVIDFKTDYITENNIDDKVAQYTSQVTAYANAISRIYQKPIISAFLYFFSTEQLIAIM